MFRKFWLSILAFVILVSGLQLLTIDHSHAATSPSVNYAVNQSFNGTSTYLDKTTDVSSISGLTQGSIAVRFKSSSTAIAKTFLSASHTADASSNISFTMNNGTVYYENRENGVNTSLSASGSYNDGVWHTAILTVNSSGTKIYVDGVQKASSASTKFFSNVSSLNGMWVGRNMDSTGGEWYYAGEIDYVRVYNAVLPATEISDLSMRIDYTIPFIDLKDQTNRQILTDREAGQYLGQPDSILLNDGQTIFTVYPKGHGVGPVILKKSTNGGITWSSRLPTPSTWTTSQETPTLYSVVKPNGTTRLLMISGLPTSPGGFKTAFSDNAGTSWSEFTHYYANSGYNGWVAHASLTRLKKTDGSWDHKYMAIFHDGGYNNWKTYLTFDANGNEQWSNPERLLAAHNAIEKYAGLCEIDVIRSPDGNQLALLARAQHKKTNAMVAFSNDEGITWTEPREMQGALMGERHKATYDPISGRLLITFRDIIRNSVSDTGAWMAGDWVAWVGTYDDLVNSREGQYRVRLMEDFTPSAKSGDTGYAGNVVLADGTYVLTSYGYFDPNDTSKPYIMTVRLKLSELDNSTAPLFNPSLNYKISNRNSGKVLDVYGSSSVNGGNVIQWTESGGLNQKWGIEDIGNGYYKIVNRQSGKVLEVAAASTSDGGDIVQWTYGGANNQQWSIEALDGGYYKLINRHSGKAADVNAGSTTNGADVLQWTYHGGNNQQWTITQ